MNTKQDVMKRRCKLPCKERTSHNKDTAAAAAQAASKVPTYNSAGTQKKAKKKKSIISMQIRCHKP